MYSFTFQSKLNIHSFFFCWTCIPQPTLASNSPRRLPDGLYNTTTYNLWLSYAWPTPSFFEPFHTNWEYCNDDSSFRASYRLPSLHHPFTIISPMSHKKTHLHFIIRHELILLLTCDLWWITCVQFKYILVIVIGQWQQVTIGQTVCTFHCFSVQFVVFL